ncbi:hypothetical protein Tco_1156673 [Tanacetum coccineum]
MMNVGTILNDNLDVTEQQGKSNSPGNDTDAEGAKISKNGSNDDITIAKSSHDKDKTEVQWSNNGLFKNDHELEKTNENNKALKEANDLLTKELKTYKEKVRVFEMTKGNNTTYFNEYIKADRIAKRFENNLERQKTQAIFKQQLSDKEDKYLNDILQLQAKNKDLDNVVCKMGKSTETPRLLTNEQRAYRDNICNLSLGYKGPYVLSLANAKISKLYSAYELREENVQLHVFNSEKTLENAENRRLKMKEFQKDEKVQELKIKPIDYTNLNNLYENFVPQVELSLEQKYFSETFISSETYSNASTSNSPPTTMPIEVKEMMDVFVSMESDLDETLKQNKLLKDRLLEVTLAEDVKNLVINSCVEIRNKNLQDEIERFSRVKRYDSSLSSITKSNIFELEKESGENICDNAKCELQTNIVELEKVLTQKTKDFDDVKLKLSNITAKFEAYFEKLENTKVVLERQLARKIDDSKVKKDQFLKEINHLRTQLENLKGKYVETKFDKPSILRKQPSDKLLINSQILKSWFTPKVVVQKDLSKPITTQSLPKNKKDQLLKRIASLESNFASQDLCSCQKEYHELRTSYNALKVNFDSLNRTKRKNNVFNSSKPKVNVSEKVHTGESSKLFSKRVS